MTAGSQHHPLLIAFLDALRARGKSSTAASYDQVLGYLTRWLADQRLDAATVTTDDLGRFQQFISNTYRTATGEPLAKSTQGTITAVLHSAYTWMHRRGLILHQPAASLAMPLVPRRLSVAKESLTQDECIAFLNTLSAVEAEAVRGTIAHALAQRNLALFALALASGLRCHTLIDLRLGQVDTAACTLRIDWSKGKAGRVLPTAPWALAPVKHWLSEGRVHLLRGGEGDRVFISQRRGRLCHKAVSYLLGEAVADTIGRNPDLADLPGKRVTTHSLRVSTALLLHHGGCDLRSLSELLLHGSAGAPGLAVTGRYLPTTTDDVARALRGHHPRW